jgi:predicted alpha/beta hydrolase family esterase
MYDDVLILPGLYDSGPRHWQSRWKALHPEMRRVNQTDWETPSYDDWAGTLEAAVAGLAAPPVLVGHSSACALVARWSVRTRLRAKGALLVGPSDTDAPSYPAGPTGFAPMPLDPIPFPTIVVASDDDPYVTEERARVFAERWGSELVVIPGAGHLNSDSGLGDWPDGLALVDRLLASGRSAP